MIKPDRSALTPLDFREWREAGTLVIRPKFQRREVWTTPKKSYLIDTLLKQMPVPPIYFRVTQSEDRKKIIREVIDGQQRINAILDFMDEKYSLSPTQAAEHGASRYGKLKQDQQDLIAQSSVMCESFQGISDAEVLEIFARVNTYSVQLNRQELLNGKYFGFFKTFVYKLAYEHLEFWRKHRIYNEAAIARMAEVELTSELVIILIAGMQHKKDTIEDFYERYNDSFSIQSKVDKCFRHVIDTVEVIAGDILADTEFHRPPFFYTLFAVIAHRLFRIDGQTLGTKHSPTLSKEEVCAARDALVKLTEGITRIKSGESQSAFSREFVSACLKSTDKLEQREARFRTIYSRMLGA